MRTIYFCVSLICLSQVVFGDVEAKRILPGDIYIPGTEFIVTIEVTGDTSPVTVVEKIPIGWLLGRVTSSGQVDNDVITWERDTFSRSLKFAYYITPYSDSIEQVVFSGNINGQEIGGMTVMNPLPFRVGNPSKLEFSNDPGFNAYGNPWVSADNLTLLFNSQSLSSDIWMATRVSEFDIWGPPKKLDDTINTPYMDESSPSMSNDGLSLFFSSNRYNWDYDLWIATRVSLENEWNEPIRLSEYVNCSDAEWCPKISNDNNSLYFVSNRSGGYGWFDIWVSTRASESDEWGIAVNLGPVVNSSGVEWNPCIAADGLTLLFSAWLPGDIKRYEIFITTRDSKNDDWRAPVKLDATINTNNYETGAFISSDGRILYFDRTESSTTDDPMIWQAPLEWIVSTAVMNWRHYE